MSETMNLEIDDLVADAGIELNEEELQSVSGARMSLTGCGARNQNDDWIIF
jgi:bacteriocin-like protein